MKLIKKSLSIVLAVMMLASVCTCLLTSNVGAYTVSNDTYLALDFEKGTGLADIRNYNNKNFEFAYEKGTQKDGSIGTYPVFTSHSYQGWSAVLGNYDSVESVSVANKPHANRFQVTEPGTYTITMDVKYFAGSYQPNTDDLSKETFYLQAYRCQIADPNNKVGKLGGAEFAVVKFSDLTKDVDYKEVAGKKSDGSDYTYAELIKDTAWGTYSVNVKFVETDISAGRTSICITAGAGSADYINDTNGNFKYAIDNVRVIKTDSETVTETRTYVYDFKDANGNVANYANMGHENFSGSATSGDNAKGAKVDVDGMHFCTENTNFGIQGTYNWSYKAYLKDPDFKLGNDSGSHGLLRIEANSTYYISMKYKLGYVAEGVSNVKVGIGLTTGTSAGTVMVGTKAGSHDVVNVGDTDWHTYSTVIDSDTAYVASTDTSNVGKYVCIMGAANVAIDSEIIVESVTVTVVDKSTIAQANSVKATFDNGFNDIYLPQGNKLGNGTYAVVADPLNSGRGNVLQFTTTMSSTANFALPIASGMGGFNNGKTSSAYAVTKGRTYRVSYDVYLKTPVDTTDKNYGLPGSSLYLCNYDGIGNSGNKKGSFMSSAVFKEGDSATASDRRWRASYITGQWVNVTYDYTPGADADSYPYIVVAFGCTKGAVYCFDNVSITDITGVDDAASNVGTVVLDSQRGTMIGDSTVTLPVGSIFEMPIPTREGYVFAGWTESWDIANDNDYNTVSAATQTAEKFQNVVTMSPEIASRTVLAVKPGVTRYYAIWVGKTTFEFNDLEKYLGSTFGMTAAGNYSSGDFYGEDFDGDGKMDAIGLDKATKGSNQFSICLGEEKTSFGLTYTDMYTLHEGVTYKITFNKKIDKLSTTNNKATIGINRGFGVGYANVPVEGAPSYNSTKLKDFTATEDSYSEYTTTFKVFGMFNSSYNGDNTANAGYSLNFKNGLHLIVYNGSILFDSVTIEAVSYDDGRVVVNGANADDVNVSVDYTNKTVKVDGATVNTNSVSVFNNYYLAADYASAKATYKLYGQAKCVDLANGEFSFANNTELLTPNDPMFTRVIVDIVPETLKRSIRAEGMVGGKYQSAGLRFRFTLTDDMKKDATEIGFIASPDASSEDWYINHAESKAKVAVVYDGTTDKVYASGAGTTDYQLIVTGLTRENATKDAKDMTIYVVMYVTTAEGTEYYYVGASSYNDVKDAYADNGTTADGNGNNY